MANSSGGANVSTAMEDGALHVQIIAVGNVGPDIQLKQESPGFALTQGQSYRVAFDAWAVAARGVGVSVWENGHDLDGDGFAWSPHGYQAFNLTDTHTTYSFDLTMGVDNPSAGIASFCGSEAPDLYVVDVSVRPLP